MVWQIYEKYAQTGGVKVMRNIRMSAPNQMLSQIMNTDFTNELQRNHAKKKQQQRKITNNTKKKKNEMLAHHKVHERRHLKINKK